MHQHFVCYHYAATLSGMILSRALSKCEVTPLHTPLRCFYFFAAPDLLPNLCDWNPGLAKLNNGLFLARSQMNRERKNHTE